MPYPGEIEAFKSLIGWSSMPPPDRSGGVCADWSKLPEALQPVLGGLRQSSETVYSDEPGTVQLHLTWRRGSNAMAVGVLVSMDPMQVRDNLIFTASSTTRMTIPYVRGPHDLGEISIRHRGRQSDALMWVFHNVFVRVDNGMSGFDIVPAAYAIQAFMNRCLTPALAGAARRVEGIQLSPSAIQVGNEVRVSVTLESGTAPGLTTRIRESSPGLLDLKGADALSATFLAKSPGQTRINVTLIDKKTLLSPPLGVPVEVLP